MNESTQTFTINAKTQLPVIAGLLLQELNADNAHTAVYTAHNGIDSKDGDTIIRNPVRGIRVTYHLRDGSKDLGDIYVTIRRSTHNGNRNEGYSFEVSGKPITPDLVAKVQSTLEVVEALDQIVN